MSLDALQDPSQELKSFDGTIRYPNGQPIRTSAVVELIRLQRRAYAASARDDLKPSILAGLMRSIALIDARICAHRMKPLPKSVDPVKYAQAKAASRKQSSSNRRATPTGIAQPQQQTTTDKESLSQPGGGSGAEGEGTTRTGGDNETPTQSGNQGD